ncbi:MAG: hypothetical protein DRO99_00420 [Candidatus Aenigmatarchaeota archaeon]|nr:MAG: hypothetical protein DRO99_00420 [Candidatus Aenigmarchaeota archaeon]
MSRAHILAVFALMLTLLAQPVFAELQKPVELSISPDYIKTDLREPAVFLLTVRNNINIPEKLKVRIIGPHIHWANNPIIMLAVPKNVTKQFNITFYPVTYRGVFDFNITMTSYAHADLFESMNVTIDIPEPIVIEDVSVEREGNDIAATFRIETLKEESIDILMNVFDSDGDLVATSDSDYTVHGERNITQRVTVPENLLAGEYVMEYTVNGNMTGGVNFTVEPVHNVDRTERLEANIVHGNVIITFKNMGNVVERDYTVYESLPSDAITGFITDPSDCSDESGRKLCEYVIPELGPGETAMISYRVEYWPAYVQLMAAVLIVAVIAGFSFIRVTKPSITKRAVRKTSTEHHIIIEIRNPFLHHLKDVVIRDWVSPLASVMQKEIESVKPVLKRSDAGTELIWKLGDIKPKEVRILSYKIKTAVEGNLKMPRAYARFRTPKGGRGKVFSGQIQVG